MQTQAKRLGRREVASDYLPKKKMCTSRAFSHMRQNTIAQTLGGKVRRGLKNKDNNDFSMNLTDETGYGRYMFGLKDNIFEMFSSSINLKAGGPFGSAFKGFLMPISDLDPTDEYFPAMQQGYCYHRTALEEGYGGLNRSLDNIRTFVGIKLLKEHLEKGTSLGNAITDVDELIKKVVSLLEGGDFEEANNVFGKVIEACRSIEAILDKR